ncbi:MAG: hypothetical protein JWR69_3054, partial [Pedosphaera sp.]|nr:hypothetical protein [Pedosphaera sp.]
MKPKSTILIFSVLITLTAALLSTPVQAQTNPAPPVVQSPADFFASLQTALQNINTNANYFADQELELKIGGVYAQSTGEGGVVTDIEDWGRFAKNL